MVHLQNILHIVEETYEQVAGVGAGSEHWREDMGKLTESEDFKIRLTLRSSVKVCTPLVVAFAT